MRGSGAPRERIALDPRRLRQHALVAEGSLDAAVDARLAPWNFPALVPIVDEAGGRVSARDGGPPRPNEQVVSSNGLLHDELLELLNRS